MNPSFDRKTVLVTGGSGYLGSWLVKSLLAQGHRVHTTVRRVRDVARYEHLLKLEPDVSRLEIFEADLLAEGSFDAAVSGCDVVIHTASPFAIKGIKDARKELIDPAVRGTRNVLGAVNRCPSVRRVVLTSSVAAIYGDAADLGSHASFSEDDWNESSTEAHQPYAYSKTLAERAAWEIAGAQKRWDLVVINPGFILGPSVNAASTGVSQTIMRNFGDGTFRSGMVDLWYGFVDVRDVAAAHLKAAFGAGASGRYILSNRSASLLDVAAVLRKSFGDKFPFPKSKVPKALLWLLPSVFGFTRRYVTRNVGVPLALDNRRSREELRVEYRDFEEMIREHFAQLFAPTGGVSEKTLPAAR